MKRKASALTLILSLLVSMAGMYFFSLGAVNGEVPHLIPDALKISMGSLDSSKVYAPNSDVVLTFSVANDIGAAIFYALYPSEGWFLYSLDNNLNVTAMPNAISREVSVVTSHHGGPTQIETTGYSVTINLHGAYEGQHKIAVYIGVGIFFSQNDLFTSSYQTFDPFYFNVSGYPTIRVTSPENLTYDKADVPLITVNEHVSQITYSLDGQDNVTIAGNTTINSVPEGNHNLTVYATDETGKLGASDTVQFSVEIPEPPEQSPTIYSTSIVAITVTVFLGATVYILKRKY